MNERTTVRLPQDLLTRAKRKAAAEGRMLTSLIEDGLRLMVSADRKAVKSKHRLPRVSRATGGLMPGIDLDSFASLQEADDREGFGRLKRSP